MPEKDKMTEVLLLGNGFDLHHLLPTRYIDFLQTICFLIENKSESFRAVSDIFGSEKVLAMNAKIKASYLRYKTEYERSLISDEERKCIVSLTEENCWIRYFVQTMNKDVGWIDFESEIAEVLQHFQFFFSSESNSGVPIFRSTPEEYIHLHPLSFFSEIFDSQGVPGGIVLSLKRDFFCTERNPELCLTDEEKISDFLYKQLIDLAEAMKLYFLIFVDKPFSRVDTVSCIFDLTTATYVVSFNYTKTFETAYSLDNPVSPIVCHIHGKTDQEIVLGINSGEEDAVETINTVFLSFKKYYQRIAYNTFCDYLNILTVLRDTKRGGGRIFLKVYGHSLDITDRDIITELFDVADKIHVFYHDEWAKESYIKNVVKLFGKEGLEKLMAEKDLRFIEGTQ